MIREAIQIVEKRYVDVWDAGNEWEYATGGFIPFTPYIMKEFEVKIDTAYHITGEDGVKGLKKIQGRKNQISVFTKGGDAISSGAKSGADFLVELSGISSFMSSMDIGSDLSKRGYKWIYFPYGVKGYTDVMNKKMAEYLNTGEQNIKAELKHKSKKEQHRFMKWYLDEAKKLISKPLIKKMQKELLNRPNDTYWDNNELFLHSINVKNVKIIANVSSEQDLEITRGFMDYEYKEKMINKQGFEFGGYKFQKYLYKLGK